MKRALLFSLTVMILGALPLFALSACQPSEPAPPAESAVTAEPAQEPAPTEISTSESPAGVKEVTTGEPGPEPPGDNPEAACDDLARELGFVPNRFLVIGTPDTISQALSVAGVLSPELKSRTPLRALFGGDQSESSTLPFPRRARSQLVIDLYAIGECSTAISETTRRIVVTINQKLDDSEAQADLDRVMGLPWTLKPGSIVSPTMVEAGGPERSSQWAATSTGYNPHNALGIDGSGVVVGLFDTSPYTALGAKMVTGSFDLDYVEDYPLPSVAATAEITDHGLFGASLVNQVAPSASISLYQVLANDGQGVLSSLVSAVADFITATKGANPRRHAVINLSLGLDTCQSCTRPELNEINTFTDLMTTAVENGILPVAAAGSKGNSTTAPAAIYPASLDTVLGVASSTKNRTRSCFSNAGDIAAPGGDGVSSAGVACAPAVGDCNTNSDPCVVGLVLDPSDPPIAVNAFWVGTSFATTFASGLAALAYQHLNPSTHDVDATEAISEALLNGATGAGVVGLGAGIVDEKNTIK